mgnify:CR=1 FL=1
MRDLGAIEETEVCRRETELPYSVIFNDQTLTYSLENRTTGTLTELPLSPLFGVFSEEESVKAVYMTAPYIYYMVSCTERYVDRVGSYNSTSTQVSIVRLHMETWRSSRTVYGTIMITCPLIGTDIISKIRK